MVNIERIIFFKTCYYLLKKNNEIFQKVYLYNIFDEIQKKCCFDVIKRLQPNSISFSLCDSFKMKSHTRLATKDLTQLVIIRRVPSMLQAIAKVGHDLSSQRSGHKHFTALRTGDGTATRHATTLTLTKLESPGRRNSRSCRPCGTVACPVAAALATDAGGCCSAGGGQI